MSVLRNFVIWIAFCRNFATFSDFRKNQDLLLKNLFISQENQTLNVGRNFKLLSRFLRQLFYPKQFSKKLLSQSNSAANLLHLAIMKKVKIFSWKASCFCQRKQNFVFFLRNFNISLAFWDKFSFFSDFMKIQLLFYRKTHVFFFKKTYFVHILRNFTVAI